MSKEIWKSISWVDNIEPDKYSISSKGRIRNNYTKKILSSYLRKNNSRLDSKGIYCIKLLGKNSATIKSVCRLVATAFVPTYGISIKGLTAYNINGDVSDNSIENVSWLIGGPNNSTDSRIDISYIDKINKAIIKYNNLSNGNLVEKVNKETGLSLSKYTIQKYRSLFSKNFKYVKDSSPDVIDSFWSSNKTVDMCESNTLKNRKSVIKYDTDMNIIDIFSSVGETLKSCKITDRTFYRHIRNKDEYPYITNRTGEKFILEYSK